VGGLMTNDHASSQARPEPDQSTPEVDGQTQHASVRKPKRIIPTLLKGWRALAFLLIVLIVGSYAFHYKAISDPGSESKQLADHAPQELDFFASSPGVSIDVNAYITSAIEPAGTTLLQPVASNSISITVHAPPHIRSVTILMLTSTSRFYGPGEFYFSPLKNVQQRNSWAQQSIDGFFASTFSFSAGTGYTMNDELFGIGGDLEQTNAYLYGHLPAIGAIDQALRYNSPNPFVYLQPGAPAILVERDQNLSYILRDVLLEPTRYGQIISSPKSYRTPYGGPGELFYPPSEFSITETQSGLGSAIENQQVTHITPGGQVDESDYTWQGSGYLEPTLQAANADALQGEGNDAFLSGVLFGIAGAAAIAFVQEIPETFDKSVWWSRRKRKRKSSSQNASESSVSQDSRSPTGLGWPQ
jgi:hypothetical protein